MDVTQIQTKVKELITREARNIARLVGFSVGSAFTILIVRRLTARWIPHLLTMRTAREILKQYPKIDKNLFNTFITGDKKCVHVFEPQRKVNNKIWATINAKRPCLTKKAVRK